MKFLKKRPVNSLHLHEQFSGSPAKTVKSMKWLIVIHLNIWPVYCEAHWSGGDQTTSLTKHVSRGSFQGDEVFSSNIVLSAYTDSSGYRSVKKAGCFQTYSISKHIASETYLWNYLLHLFPGLQQVWSDYEVVVRWRSEFCICRGQKTFFTKKSNFNWENFKKRCLRVAIFDRLID